MIDPVDNHRVAEVPAWGNMACPAPGWEARVLRQPPFPLPEPARIDVARRIVELGQLLVSDGMHGQLFLQNWKLSSETGNDIVSEHLAVWKLRRGLGIWKGRPAPSGWTETSLMDAAAAAFQGEEPHLPLHHLLQLSTEPQELMHAIEELAGRGVALMVFAREPIDPAIDRVSTFLREQVAGKFKRSPFLLPLFDGAGLKADASATPFEEWMSGVDVYLRESAEDGGLLLLSRQELTPVLKELMLSFVSLQPYPPNPQLHP